MGDKHFEPLRTRIAINQRPETLSLEMMADKSRPTKEELQLLSDYKADRDECVVRGESFRANFAPPGYVAQFNANIARVNELLARLYAGEMNYGEFNRARAGNVADNQSKMAEIDRREREANAAREADAQAQRSMAVRDALQTMQTQQLIQQQQMQINRANMPRNTNCQRLGNQVNCTTY